jgi:hypothetical protein
MKGGSVSSRFVLWKSGKFQFTPNEIGTFGERIVAELLRKQDFKVKPRQARLRYTIFQLDEQKSEFQPKDARNREFLKVKIS